MGCDGSDGGAAAAWTVGVVCVGAGGDVTGAAGGAGAGAGLGCGFGLGGEGCVMFDPRKTLFLSCGNYLAIA